jgi:hypothetical protein
MIKVKKKRKDTYKNRNKPKGGRIERGFGILKSIDGTIEGIRWHPEKMKTVKGTICGRCGATKSNGKCDNRMTLSKIYSFYRGNLPKEIEILVKGIKNKYRSKRLYIDEVGKNVRFCIKDKEVFLQ